MLVGVDVYGLMAHSVSWLYQKLNFLTPIHLWESYKSWMEVKPNSNLWPAIQDPVLSKPETTWDKEPYSLSFFTLRVELNLSS